MKLIAKRAVWFIVFIQIALLIVTHWLNQTTLSTASAAAALTFVDENQQPLNNQTIRILCYQDSSAGNPFLDLQSNTNEAGLLDTALPAHCHYIAALHLLREQAGKENHGDAYQIYNTSWPAGTAAPAPVPADGEIEISSANRLVLFNVVVSLEWEPAVGSTYLTELRRGLSAASAHLYDLSEGQMALGAVAIYTNGERWLDADIRLRAANDYRPSAYVGGIVAEPTRYDIAGTNDDPIYAPGAIYLGRYWDGDDAFDPASGRWNQPAAYRTLVHEWAHYALFLYDEYQQENGAATYCVCDGLPDNECAFGDLNGSLMAYHYTADELWFTPLHGSPAACTNTDQFHVHGQSDWETLQLWPQIQGGTESLHDPVNLTAGPLLGLTADLFGRTPAYDLYLPILLTAGDPPQPAEHTAEITATVEIDEAAPADSKLPARVYVLEEGDKTTPDRILYHGTPIGGTQPGGELGQLTLPGVTSTEEARVFVTRFTRNEDTTAGKGYIYPELGQPAAGLDSDLTLTATTNDWNASVDLTYELSGTLFTTMTVHLTSINPVIITPTVRLCTADAAVGCASEWSQPMNDQGSNIWTASFNPLAGQDELPLYAVVHIEAPRLGERIVHYQVAGGVGPAHVDAYAPLRDGQATISTDINIKGDGACNRVFIATADNFAFTITPLGQAPDTSGNPANVGGLIGWPIDLDIIIPDGSLQCANNTPEDHALQVPMLLTHFYSENTLAELGITSSQLRLLHFTRTPSPTAGFWSPLTTLGSSDPLNWLSASITTDGIYAIGWVP